MIITDYLKHIFHGTNMHILFIPKAPLHSINEEMKLMSTFIEDFYYGNIEPQEVNSELTPKFKKKLSNLAEKEEQLTARLAFKGLFFENK